MERLTKTGQVFTFPKIDPAENAYLERVQKRLAAYEDTGLEPEQIMGLCEMERRAKMADLLRLEEYQALGTVEELSALVKAQDEGPCGLCRFHPPSSCDGKPCTMYPAEGISPTEAEVALSCQKCRESGAEKVCEDKRTGYVCPNKAALGGGGDGT